LSFLGDRFDEIALKNVFMICKEIKMLNRFKLSGKLNLILLLVFLIFVIFNGFILSQTLQKNAENEITSKASLLIETMGAVRDYTSIQIEPQLAARLETEDQFLPQTVPGYSAREVFENLRKRRRYSDFFYKEATLNPTNLRDKADEFESSVINKFRNKISLKELTGFRTYPSGDIFYVARPIRIANQSCLRCHSTPQAAPKSQITTYGSENGFGWKPNEIVGATIISVPVSKILAEAKRLQMLIVSILAVGCILAILILNVFLRVSIIAPLASMAQWSKQVSTGVISTEFRHPSKDEIGILASSLNRLKVSLEIAMNMLSQDKP
jgi:HAMP domain-containing protein